MKREIKGFENYYVTNCGKDIARYFKLDQSNISKINTKLTWA